MSELHELARAHPGVWIEAFGWIMNKARQWVRPQLNIFQARMVAAYVWCILKGIPPRIIGLKPRQVGGTTIAAAIVYHHCRVFSCWAVTIANQFKKSRNLFRMIADYAKRDSFPWNGSVRQPNQKLLEFSNDSQIEMDTAEKPTAGRGDTLQALQMSEVAYWPNTSVKNAKEVATSLLNALADHAATLAIMESTPNGAMGLFYEQWCDARWPGFDDYWKASSTQPDGEGNGWIRVFAGWYEFPEHRESVRRKRPITEAEAAEVMGNLSPKEKEGVARWGWDADQILWWRWVLKAKCLNDENRRDEEYPSDPEKCFLSSGRPRFDTEGVTRIVIAARARCETGLLSLQGERVAWQGTGENEALYWVWERPKIGCRYIISIDTMRGESETDRTEDSDCHSVLVWRAAYKDEDDTWHNPRLVARIAPPCRLDNKPGAKLVDLLSRWYGRCRVAIEVNNGIGMLKELRDLDVPLYRMVAWDKAKQKHVESLGWETNADRREMIISELATRIREETVDIECPHLAAELQTFVINKKGKAEALSGKHDDDVMSAAIGLIVIESADEYTEAAVERRLPEDWHRWK